MNTTTSMPDVLSVTSAGTSTSFDVVYNDTQYDDNVTFTDVPLVKQPIHMIVVYSIAYGLIFVFAVIGNCFVIAVIIKDPRMRNVTNYFILNVAVADLLVALLVVPITLLDSIFSGWRFGAFLCKTTPYVQAVVQCASVNTLAAIAFDRYLAICYTRHSKITACASRSTIISIWIFAAVIMIPFLVYYTSYMHEYYVNVPICHQLWPSPELQRSYFLVALFLLCYILPLMMILLCYLLIANKVWKRDAPGVETNGRLVIYKSKVKVLKMLAVIVLLFAFSWLPLYAIHLRLYFGSPDISPEAHKIIFEIGVPLAQWLGSSNCGINPIIYCFFSKKYRRGFKHILFCQLAPIEIRRRSHVTHSMSTRYMNVDSSIQNSDHRLEHRSTDHRVSVNKYLVEAFTNGTVSFRKDKPSDESSF